MTRVAGGKGGLCKEGSTSVVKGARTMGNTMAIITMAIIWYMSSLLFLCMQDA